MLEPLLQAIGEWPGATWLQRSGTAYLFVNAAHILGIGLLLGAILPLDLRMLGFARHVPLPVIGPFLSRSASIGLAVAVVTGAWLFSVQPDEYAANAAFLWKLPLIGIALVNVGLQHRSDAYRAAIAGGPVVRRARLHAAASMLLWLSVLLAGRWIGFL
jgi:hypothetical protein